MPEPAEPGERGVVCEACPDLVGVASQGVAAVTAPGLAFTPCLLRCSLGTAAEDHGRGDST